MSPILFNIVAYMLSILTKRAKNDCVKGVIPHLAWEMVYVFCNMHYNDHDLEQANNMKLMLASLNGC